MRDVPVRGDTNLCGEERGGIPVAEPFGKLRDQLSKPPEEGARAPRLMINLYFSSHKKCSPVGEHFFIQHLSIYLYDFHTRLSISNSQNMPLAYAKLKKAEGSTAPSGNLYSAVYLPVWML